MTSSLDNLVRIGQLKKEPPDRAEVEGLLQSGRDKLKDAHNTSLSFASRFDLAYNAAHALDRHHYAPADGDGEATEEVESSVPDPDLW